MAGGSEDRGYKPRRTPLDLSNYICLPLALRQIKTSWGNLHNVTKQFSGVCEVPKPHWARVPTFAPNLLITARDLRPATCIQFNFVYISYNFFNIQFVCWQKDIVFYKRHLYQNFSDLFYTLSSSSDLWQTDQERIYLCSKIYSYLHTLHALFIPCFFGKNNGAPYASIHINYSFYTCSSAFDVLLRI